MSDREKVIKAVEEAFDLVHSDFIGTYDFDETEWEKNKADALALLKEQEAKPVEVCGQMFTIKYGHCPKCGKGMDSEVYPHWCGFCGQAVKWE